MVGKRINEFDNIDCLDTPNSSESKNCAKQPKIHNNSLSENPIQNDDQNDDENNVSSYCGSFHSAREAFFPNNYDESDESKNRKSEVVTNDVRPSAPKIYKKIEMKTLSNNPELKTMKKKLIHLLYGYPTTEELPVNVYDTEEPVNFNGTEEPANFNDTVIQSEDTNLIMQTPQSNKKVTFFNANEAV